MAAKVTVLVPTYNRAKLIGASLRSALAQTLPAHEIIVIDDGSTDETRDVVAAFAPAVTYLPKENAGKAAAMNLGLQRATGDLVMTLDDDDLLPPDTLERHVAALEADPTADFSYGRYSRFTDESQAAESDDIHHIPPDERRLVVRLLESPFLPNPAWMARREALLREGGYDTGLLRSQDYDMIVRLARANEGAFVDGIVLHQRTHSGMRGPASVAVKATHTTSLWIDFDRRMLSGNDSRWSDADFRPFIGDYAGQERLALLQRGVLLFVRKVYDRAETVLGEYRAALGHGQPTPEERRIARSLLSCNHGIDELLASGETVSTWLRGLKFPTSLAAAFGYHLRWRLKAAMRGKQWAEARALLRFGTRAFGIAAWPRLLLSR